MKRLTEARAVAFLLPSAAGAAGSEKMAVPQTVMALQGCWQRNGDAIGKKVAIKLIAKPIVERAIFAVDVGSYAEADHNDRYAEHLIRRLQFAAWHQRITYQYPDAAFVNQRRLKQGRLTWAIVARNELGKESAFASYSFAKAVRQRSGFPQYAASPEQDTLRFDRRWLELHGARSRTCSR